MDYTECNLISPLQSCIQKCGKPIFLMLKVTTL
nr:MAG TPA: hypothetical protein [Caudoviricetes sp.]